MTTAAPQFTTHNVMLEWQYRQVLQQLSLLQDHAADPTCPCNWADMGEWCVPKHLNTLAGYGYETAAMETDQDRRDVWFELGHDATETHVQAKAVICGDPEADAGDLVEWSRGWRKRIEPWYYLCETGDKRVKLGQAPETKIRVSGTCGLDGECNLKVTASDSLTAATSADELESTIQSVIGKIQDRGEIGSGSAETWALGPASLRRYELRYELAESYDLVASHDPETFEPNPDYPQDLQPRLRGRTANREQVRSIAVDLDPDALLAEFHSIDRGAPIVADGGVVLSGNGRAMAIDLAARKHPESYQGYQVALEERADQFGADARKVRSMLRPVLVRRLITDVDLEEFAAEANASSGIAQSAVEQARNDADVITPTMLAGLEVLESEGIGDALRSPRNARFVASFMSYMPRNEQAALSDSDGNLNQDGVRRLVIAVFLATFWGDAGLRLAERWFEAVDPDVRNVLNGISASLGPLARAEAMSMAGDRDPGLAIAEDLATAVEVFADLRRTGSSVEDYLAQSQMFERRTNDLQERLLTLIDERRRSGKRIAELLRAYAGVVIDSTPPQQGSLLGDDGGISKMEALDMAVRRAADPGEQAALMQAVATCRYQSAGLRQPSRLPIDPARDFRSDRETAFTMCSTRTGQVVRGTEATGGDRYSVSLPVRCPSGHQTLGVHHTHPGGVAEPSSADIREARRMGLRWMCISVPETGETKCHMVT